MRKNGILVGFHPPREIHSFIQEEGGQGLHTCASFTKDYAIVLIQNVVQILYFGNFKKCFTCSNVNKCTGIYK